MRFLKLYRRRCVVALPLLAILVILVYRTLCGNISDNQLVAHSLALQGASSFNPRSLVSGIYSYISSLLDPKLESSLFKSPFGTEEGLHFHWDDWVDLSVADKYLKEFRNLYPDGKCDDWLRDYASVNPYFMESHKTKILRGMVNLYCVKDIPQRVLASTDKGFVEIRVSDNKRVGEDNVPMGATKRSVVKQMEELQPHAQSTDGSNGVITFHPYKKLEKVVDIDPMDFVFNPDTKIFALKAALNMNSILEDDVQYLQFLESANAQVDTADRFFKYPWIYTDVVSGRSHHTSFPFFNRYISKRERQSVLHHMVRVWFQFAESQGINSWITSGTLLGWAYNGVNMPWDTDIDIQIPIAQLDKLSRKFNSTLVVENPRDGNAKFLFEVSPTYIRQGNGRNFIDARFIEISTGLYIDLVGVSHTGDVPPVDLSQSDSALTKLMSMPVHCKHWNWNSLEELLPLRHTYFEGASIYIPKNALAILVRGYGVESFTTKLDFNNHHYDSELGLWVPISDCTIACSALSLLEIPNPLGNCRSDRLEDEIRIVERCAARHKLMNADLDHPIDYDLDSFEDLPLSRKDVWDYLNDINNKKATGTGWYVGP